MKRFGDLKRNRVQKSLKSETSYKNLSIKGLTVLISLSFLTPFCNAQTSIKYDSITTYSEGLAAVKLNGKWGYIDETGKEVIPLKYDKIYDFFNGLALAKEGSSYYLVNNKNEDIFKVRILPFRDGVAIITIHKKEKGDENACSYYGYINEKGKIIVPPNYRGLPNNVSGFIFRGYNFDKEFKPIMIGDYKLIHPFSEQLAAVTLNDKWGFIDKNGIEIISLQYNNAKKFCEGLAGVELSGKWGFIDKTGKEIIPLNYDEVDNFVDGLANVKLNGKYGYIDKTGKMIIPLKYDLSAKDFSEGLAAVAVKESYRKKWGFIDKTGKEVIPLKYENNFIISFHEDLAGVKLNGKWGFIDKTGKEVISFKYGNNIFETGCFFEEGLAAVELNGKWGFIDKTGKEIIPFKYDDVNNFSDGFAKVYLGSESFYIDKNGNKKTEK